MKDEEHIPLSSSMDSLDEIEKDDLPRPISTPAPAPTHPAWVTPYTIIPIWILLSSGVILYNNYLYTTLQFKYPVFLVTWHLTFASIGTRILHRTTPLLDGLKNVSITRDIFIRSILPIGLLFSCSLVLGNTAYLYLSVHYIQMLKAFTPVAILLISFAFRIQEVNRKLLTVVFLISFGVALASRGELKFHMFGFLVQSAAVVFEAARLVMIQILLHGLKMDPLVSLHFYAPVCALINLAVLPFAEGLAPFYALAQLGPWVIISNALIAFLLNISAVFLVSVGSGLILTLAGVFKDILLIAGSVVLFSAQITPLQVFGYSIALAGLVFFKTMGAK